MTENALSVIANHDHGTETNGSLDRVPVSTFSWCTCSSSEYATKHLLVRSSEVQLLPGTAIAISYGIGDYERSVHTFGHHEGDPSSAVRLTFGDEWSVQSLAEAFVALSIQHGALWLDQLSIPQDPKLIPLHLQNMPKIYRTFEVIVLQPNAPCPCLAEALAAYDAGGEGAERVSDRQGEFDLRRRADACLNAVPLSSYHYRLWTKQEFVHARSISMHYCGPPAGPCTRDTVYEWSVRTRTLSAAQRAFMGKWSGWLYEKFCAEAAGQGQWQDEAAWSMMEQHLAAGIDSIMLSVWSFLSRKDLEYLEANLRKYEYLITRFILGDKLSRTKNDLEEMMIFSDMDGGHVASVTQDFVLAVFPTVSTYQIPANVATLSVAALLDDALVQYETASGEFTKSCLPRGLFSLGRPSSMRCQPSLFLPATERINSIRDVYGSMQTGTFRTTTSNGFVMLGLRSSSQTNPTVRSRFPSAMTYTSAFPHSDPESTEKALKFARSVSAPTHHHFGPSHLQGPLGSWARAVIRDDIVFSRAKGDTWASPAHEKAVFDALLHVGKTREGWGDLPFVDHEAVVYALMCDYLAIDVDVARERGLGVVVVKPDEGNDDGGGVGSGSAPCIGMVNSAVHKGLTEIEQWQRQNGGAPPSESDRTRNNVLYPEDWLTVYLGSLRGTDICYECFKLDKPYDLNGDTLPVYTVVGVWFKARKDDAFIGADVTRVRDECGALLY